MPTTFEQVWRPARLEMPACPPLLIRSWAQEGFSRLCDSWGWAFLRSENTLVTLDSRSITVTFTNGVTSAGSAALFVASDAGRQIRVARLPIYTIAAVVDASTVTLDRAYTEVTATVAATIQDCYTVMPADFRRFLVIQDRYYQRIIPFWYNEDQLAVSDPGRQIGGADGVRYVVAQRYSTATATLGQVRYEYWPSPTTARTYPYLYLTKAQTLNDSDVLPGVLSERPDLLRLYVMYRAAQWPGTVDQRNLGYDLARAQGLKAEWDRELQVLSLADDNEYPQQELQVDWAARTGILTQTAKYLRQTDATVNDFW